MRKTAEIFKRLLGRITELKNYLVLIIPHNSKGTHINIKAGRIAAFIAGYTVIVGLLGFIILNFTPAASLFASDARTKSEELKTAEELNKRIKSLAKELEGFKNANDRLRKAVMLGDSTILKDSSSKKTPVKLKAAGNLLGIWKHLFSVSGRQTEDVFLKAPVSGFVSRYFNPDKGHFGTDYVLKTGTPVFASANGYVIFSDYTVNDGYMIILGHRDDYVTVYKHCSSLIKKVRDYVTQGDLIALSGNTGEITTGPHLHFEIWKNGFPLDPKSVLLNF